MSLRYHCLDALDKNQFHQFCEPYTKQKGTFILDSSENTNNNGRFDIIAVEPAEVFESLETSEDNPLQFLAGKLPKLNQSTIPDELSHLPCLGGVFFAISYDLGRRYETIEDNSIDDLKLSDIFSVYSPVVVITDHLLQKTFVICIDDEFIELYKNLINELTDCLNILNVNPVDSAEDQEFKLLDEWQANFTPEEYAKAFNQVQSHIHAGDCYQVNLAQRFKVKCKGDPWQAYLKLSLANHAPFSAFINTGKANILSLSPERFIQVKSDQVETRPIKGTRPRGQTIEEDVDLQNELINSKKDQAENLMIVDLMRNDLGRSCIPGSIKVPELFKLETFHSVHHLVSTITGTLEKNQDALSLLENCFPGGSITGTPKIKAMNIIDRLEPHRRYYYCGSIGYVDPRGHMDSSICIRTLVHHKDHLYCWAGGGLVSDSKLEAEYQETFDKVSKILPVLKR